MRVFDLLTMLDSQIRAENTKVHLASYNGQEDPLDLYRFGQFQTWQQGQSRRNFERSFVVALIQMPETNKWLFAGAYTTISCKPDGEGFLYDLKERPLCREIEGRLIANFHRSGRQAYLNAESWVDQILVNEIRTEKLSVPEFPGFKHLHISKTQLDIIVRENHSAWRTALSSVAGVYLISDPKSGKFYVGSATGEGGIWQRWLDYAATGHGGNRDLKTLLESGGLERAAGLQYSILEIADTHTSVNDVLQRESHWKRVLLTRIHGLNPK